MKISFIISWNEGEENILKDFLSLRKLNRMMQMEAFCIVLFWFFEEINVYFCSLSIPTNVFAIIIVNLNEESSYSAMLNWVETKLLATPRNSGSTYLDSNWVGVSYLSHIHTKLKDLLKKIVVFWSILSNSSFLSSENIFCSAILNNWNAFLYCLSL